MTKSFCRRVTEVDVSAHLMCQDGRNKNGTDIFDTKSDMVVGVAIEFVDVVVSPANTAESICIPAKNNRN